MQRRAVIYARISETDERVDKVDLQRARCREFAEGHGYLVVDEYPDDGISASKFQRRPQFERLTADAAAGKFDVLVATAEDRLSRQPRETMQLALTCGEAGIVWHTIRDGLTDPASEEGELLTYFRGWMGRREQTAKAFRQRQRFEDQRSKGLPLWGVRPFGFEANRIDHHPVEAEEIRWATKHLLAGHSAYSVVKAWNSRGLTSTRGKPFQHATVRQVLTRPRNAGLMERDGEVVKDRSAAWLPIVSRQDWEEVCSLLKDSRRAGSASREPKWLCAGIARCGVCGGPLRSATGSDRHGRFSVYRCAEKGRSPGSGPRVTHPAIKTADLDPLVRNGVVAAFLLGPGALIGEQADTAEVRRLQSRLREVRQGLSDLVDMIGTPGFSAAAVKPRAAKLDAERESIEQQLAKHARQSAHAAMLVESREALLSSGSTGRVSIKDAARLKADLADRFDALPLEQRRTLVRSLLTVTVHRGRKVAERVDIQHAVALGLNEEGEGTPA